MRDRKNPAKQHKKISVVKEVITPNPICIFCAAITVLRLKIYEDVQSNFYCRDHFLDGAVKSRKNGAGNDVVSDVEFGDFGNLR